MGVEPAAVGEPVGSVPARLTGDEPAGRAVEARDVGEQPQKRWIGKIAALGEDRIEVGAAKLQAGTRIADAEGHLRGLGRDAKPIEQGAEPGIVAIVVDDESGVDRDRPAVDLDVDGVGMTADSCVGLEHGDLVVRVEHVGRDEARHAGADDGDLHRTASSGAMTPARSTHQLQHRSASASLVRVPGSGATDRGRRSSQNCPFVSSARGSAASHTIVSAP